MRDRLYRVLQEELRKRTRAEREALKGAEPFRISRPPPAGWMPLVMPIEALAKALEVKHKRPELWDVCSDSERPLECYAVLSSAVEVGGDAEEVVYQAVIFGVPIDVVLEHLAKGDYVKVKEVVRRYRQTASLVRR